MWMFRAQLAFSFQVYLYIRWFLHLNPIIKPHFWLQLAGKYDPRKEEELRLWIEDVTGSKIEGPFMESLKDGVLLCE